MKQDIQKKDKLIAELEQANASLTQAVASLTQAKEIVGRDEVLKRCIQMLEGQHEGRDVNDLDGKRASIHFVYDGHVLTSLFQVP